MKESHYVHENVETLDTTMGHHCAAASITKKRNLKVDLGKCVQMYRAPFLYLAGPPNSPNPPLRAVMGKYNHQTTGAPCRPVLLCVIYISSFVFNTLCILTVLLNKSIQVLAFILYLN